MQTDAEVAAMTRREARRRGRAPRRAPVAALAGLAAGMWTSGAWAQAPIACFDEGVDAFASGPSMVAATASEADARAAIGASGRWEATSLQPDGGVEGDPIVLTWGFALDEDTIIAAAFPADPPQGVNEQIGESELLATFDAWFGDRATWEALVQDGFDVWSDKTGIVFVREPNDDGRAIPTGGAAGAGLVGTRPDIRIGGKLIDGPGGIVAYARPPEDGDIVLDTGDQLFYTRLDGDGAYANFINTVAHEVGHAMGLEHVCPSNVEDDLFKLMEPNIVDDFVGPQHDDLLAMQDEYGDVVEDDDSDLDAFDPGFVAGTTYARIDLSIDGPNDEDWVAIPADPGLSVNVSVQPYGEIYLHAQSIGGSCSGTSPVVLDTLDEQDLAVEIVAANGVDVLVTADATGAGGDEQIQGFAVPAGGFVRVVGDGSTAPQIYDLSVQLVPEPGSAWSAAALLCTLGWLARRRADRARR